MVKQLYNIWCIKVWKEDTHWSLWLSLSNIIWWDYSKNSNFIVHYASHFEDSNNLPWKRISTFCTFNIHDLQKKSLWKANYNITMVSIHNKFTSLKKILNHLITWIFSLHPHFFECKIEQWEQLLTSYVSEVGIVLCCQHILQQQIWDQQQKLTSLLPRKQSR